MAIVIIAIMDKNDCVPLSFRAWIIYYNFFNLTLFCWALVWDEQHEKWSTKWRVLFMSCFQCYCFKKKNKKIWKIINWTSCNVLPVILFSANGGTYESWFHGIIETRNGLGWKGPQSLIPTSLPWRGTPPLGQACPFYDHFSHPGCLWKGICYLHSPCPVFPQSPAANWSWNGALAFSLHLSEAQW